jgi:hypothetical protein
MIMNSWCTSTLTVTTTAITTIYMRLPPIEAPGTPTSTATNLRGTATGIGPTCTTATGTERCLQARGRRSSRQAEGWRPNAAGPPVHAFAPTLPVRIARAIGHCLEEGS